MWLDFVSPRTSTWVHSPTVILLFDNVLGWNLGGRRGRLRISCDRWPWVSERRERNESVQSPFLQSIFSGSPRLDHDTLDPFRLAFRAGYAGLDDIALDLPPTTIAACVRGPFLDDAVGLLRSRLGCRFRTHCGRRE